MATQNLHPDVKFGRHRVTALAGVPLTRSTHSSPANLLKVPRRKPVAARLNPEVCSEPKTPINNELNPHKNKTICHSDDNAGSAREAQPPIKLEDAKEEEEEKPKKSSVARRSAPYVTSSRGVHSSINLPGTKARPRKNVTICNSAKVISVEQKAETNKGSQKVRFNLSQGLTSCHPTGTIGPPQETQISMVDFQPRIFHRKLKQEVQTSVSSQEDDVPPQRKRTSLQSTENLSTEVKAPAGNKQSDASTQTDPVVIFVGNVSAMAEKMKHVEQWKSHTDVLHENHVLVEVCREAELQKQVVPCLPEQQQKEESDDDVIIWDGPPSPVAVGRKSGVCSVGPDRRLGPDETVKQNPSNNLVDRQTGYPNVREWEGPTHDERGTGPIERQPSGPTSQRQAGLSIRGSRQTQFGTWGQDQSGRQMQGPSDGQWLDENGKQWQDQDRMQCQGPCAMQWQDRGRNENQQQDSNEVRCYDQNVVQIHDQNLVQFPNQNVVQIHDRNLVQIHDQNVVQFRHQNVVQFPNQNVVQCQDQNLIQFPDQNVIQCHDQNLVQFPNQNVVQIHDRNLVQIHDQNVVQFRHQNVVQFPNQNVVQCQDQNLIQFPDQNVIQCHDQNVVQCQDQNVLQFPNQNVVQCHDQNVVFCQDQNVIQCPNQNVVQCQDQNVVQYQDQNVVQCQDQNVVQCQDQNVVQCHAQNVVQCHDQNVVQFPNQNVVQYQDQNVVQCQDQNVVQCQDQNVVQCHAQNVVQCHDQNVVQCPNQNVAQCQDQSVVQCQDQSVVQCQDQNVVQCQDQNVVQCQDQNVVQCPDLNAMQWQNANTIQCQSPNDEQDKPKKQKQGPNEGQDQDQKVSKWVDPNERNIQVPANKQEYDVSLDQEQRQVSVQTQVPKEKKCRGPYKKRERSMDSEGAQGRGQRRGRPPKLYTELRVNHSSKSGPPQETPEPDTTSSMLTVFQDSLGFVDERRGRGRGRGVRVRGGAFRRAGMFVPASSNASGLGSDWDPSELCDLSDSGVLYEELNQSQCLATKRRRSKRCVKPRAG